MCNRVTNPSDLCIFFRPVISDYDFYVLVLFYADDELLLARSCGEAEEMIKIKIKSNVLLFTHDGIRF